MDGTIDPFFFSKVAKPRITTFVPQDLIFFMLENAIGWSQGMIGPVEPQYFGDRPTRQSLI
jgi:hypothetical protein